MLAFSVLTPYYKEDVMYDKKQLNDVRDDVTILYYLRSIFPGKILSRAYPQMFAAFYPGMID